MKLSPGYLINPKKARMWVQVDFFLAFQHTHNLLSAIDPEVIHQKCSTWNFHMPEAHSIAPTRSESVVSRSAVNTL